MRLAPRQLAISAFDAATGRSFMASLAELNRTQWMSRDDLLVLQQRKLHRLLEYAHTHVPYYRRLFENAGFRPDDILVDATAYQQLPTLSKATIKDNFDDLITTEPEHRTRLERNSTGGSTGQTLIFLDDASFRDYRSADLHRHFQWTGWRWGEPHGYLWGAAREVDIQKTLRRRLMDWSLNLYETNAHALSEDSMSAFAQLIRRKRIKLLLGYASALKRFAQFVQQQGLDDIRLLGVVSSAEVLFSHQRRIIEATFGCQVLNRYAAREVGGIACECPEHTGLHISVEDVYVEVLRDGIPVPVGETGEVVVTNLNKFGMPLLRYELEDVGQLSDRSCPCGRGLPMMEVARGRIRELFKTRDGRMVHGSAFTKMFSTTPEVKQFQVIQKAYDHIVVNLVERSPLPAERLAYFEHAIQDIMEPGVQVEFHFLDSIPVLPSGKYRFTICEVE